MCPLGFRLRLFQTSRIEGFGLVALRTSAQVDCPGVRQDVAGSDTACIRCIRKCGRLLAGVAGETSMDALVLTSLNLQENVLEEYLL